LSIDYIREGAAVIELAELIGDLRDELTKAVAQANPNGLRFELGAVTLDVTVAVAKEAKPGAKVKFWVVELGADAAVSRTSTQQISLTLQPTMTGGGKAYVSGQAEDDED
jgi:Trypsin-co-occurring domain 2